MSMNSGPAMYNPAPVSTRPCVCVCVCVCSTMALVQHLPSPSPAVEGGGETERVPE